MNYPCVDCLLQSFAVPNPAAGANAVFNVPIRPGMMAMVVGVSFKLSLGGAPPANLQPIVAITETGEPIAFGTAGNFSHATVINVSATIGSACNSQPLVNNAAGTALIEDTAVTPVNLTFPLPRYYLRQNFTLGIGSPQITANDTVTDIRVMIAFGDLTSLCQL